MSVREDPVPRRLRVWSFALPVALLAVAAILLFWTDRLLFLALLVSVLWACSWATREGAHPNPALKIAALAVGVGWALFWVLAFLPPGTSRGPGTPAPWSFLFAWLPVLSGSTRNEVLRGLTFVLVPTSLGLAFVHRILVARGGRRVSAARSESLARAAAGFCEEWGELPLEILADRWFRRDRSAKLRARLPTPGRDRPLRISVVGVRALGEAPGGDIVGETDVEIGGRRFTLSWFQVDEERADWLVEDVTDRPIPG